MVNAYVISDPTNPENEGKVKVIRYGKELAKIINNAIDGDDAEEFGAKIFDVAEGCTFKIKCESRSSSFGGGNRMMTTYTSSKFMAPSKLEGINQKKLDEIFNGVHEINKFFKPKTQSELQRMLDQHYFCISDVETAEENEDSTEEIIPVPANIQTPIKEEVDEIFAGIPEPSKIPEVPVSNEKKTEIKTSVNSDDDTDAKLKELLASL
jgi:hypothetical protein